MRSVGVSAMSGTTRGYIKERSETRPVDNEVKLLINPVFIRGFVILKVELLVILLDECLT